MTAFIDWSLSYNMFELTLMFGNDASVIFVPPYWLKNIKPMLKQLNIHQVNIGSSINAEQRIIINAALKG